MAVPPGLTFDASISPRFATYVYAFLISKGIDPAPIFSIARIACREGDEFTAPLSPAHISELLRAVSITMQDPNIGLTIGSEFKFEYAGLNPLIMISSPNLKQALNNRVLYDAFINSAIYDQIKIYQNRLKHGFRISTGENIDLRHMHELIAAQILAVLRTGTGKNLSPKSVGFTHDCSSHIEVYREYFGCSNIQFNCSINEMTYSSSVVNHRFLTSNRNLNKLLTESVSLLSKGKRDTFSDAVHREIIRLLDQALPTPAQVAANLYVSCRTLRRNLKNEGVNFQQVKQDAMHKKAKQLLALSDVPLKDIASQLGFSENSAFSRAFKRWEGISPLKYRKMC